MRELLARRVGLIGTPPEIGPDTRVPPHILGEVERALLEGDTHYTVRPGIPELRRRVVQVLAEMGGPRFDGPHNALITTGETESLFVTLLDLHDNPGIALAACVFPCRHGSLFRLLNLELCRPDDEIPDSGVRLVYREAQACATGQQALIDRAVEDNLPDILNLGTALASGIPTGFPPYASDRTVIVGSFDALPGAASFRLGYLAGPERFVRRAAVWKQAFSICSAAPSQRAILKSLESLRKEAP